MARAKNKKKNKKYHITKNTDSNKYQSLEMACRVMSGAVRALGEDIKFEQ